MSRKHHLTVMLPDAKMAHASVRFGLGRRPSDPAGDAQTWLMDQITAPDPADMSGLPPTPRCFEAWRLDGIDPRPGTPRITEILAREKTAAMATALTTPAPFRERLVWFWANHFTVSLARLEVIPTAGAFVREAIRPHVFGRFNDMLLAVMRHPAMLMYLDNASSFGPDSPQGRASGQGLNENLGRECLELHTVSIAGGYTQADVTAFSKVITGWTVDFGATLPDFVFAPGLHEPGTKQVMGRTVQEGEQAGIDTLAWLAAHPATHRFLATKLVRHFVADDPAADDVARIAAVFAATGGNLAAVAAALVAMPSAWTPGAKLRTPVDYVVAAGRAVGLQSKDAAMLPGVLAGLGQPLWTAPLPNGWADRAASWAGPEALLRRAEWSGGLAARADPDAEPAELADAVLGPLLQPATRQRIAAAGSRKVALTLMMSAPEFMRR